MHNVKHEIVGDKLIIEIELNPSALAAAPMSSTGKTRLLASTAGTVALPPLPACEGKAASFSVNVMVKV